MLRERLPRLPLVVAALLALALAAGFATGCGQSSDTTGGGGSISEKYDLSGPQSTAQFTVGSENFAEQKVLGQIALQALEAAGADVEDRTGLGGNEAVRQALLDNDINMYWEYTATGWLVFLANTNPISNPQKQYEAVAKQDLKENDIEWLQPAPANNTYAVAQSEKTRKDLGVKNISDLVQLVEKSPDKAELCFGNENDFQSRVDGLPGLERAYGFKYPQDSLSVVPLDSVYEFVSRGQRCNFGVVFLTSGFLEEKNLNLLKDDKNFFAVYNPAPTVSRKTLKDYPQLKGIFGPISKKLDTETLRKLDAAVEVDGKNPENVARNWLRENGFIG